MWIGAGLGIATVLVTVVLIAVGSSSENMTSTIECDRVGGVLRTVYPLATHEIRLADIETFELGTEGHGLGRGARVETTYGIVAKLKDGERKLTTFTADPATVDRYRAAIEQLRDFQKGTAPSLKLTFDPKQSRASRANDLAGLILVGVLIIGGLIYLYLRRR